MIYVFLAEGFEEVEALTPVDCLRRAGKKVCTVGVGSRTVEGTHKIPVTADITLDEVVLDNNLEMVILPGGMPGTRNLGQSDAVKNAVQYAYDNGKWVAAICAAPTVLGQMGLLQGKKATCYPGCEGDMQGARLSRDTVCVDGKIVTAKGVGAAMEFGLKLVECLLSKDVRKALAEKMIVKL